METIDFPPSAVPQDYSNPSLWSRLTKISIDPWQMVRQRIVSLSRRHRGATAFDIMRTKLLQDAHQHGWHTIGITAPTNGCGKTTVAVNLAVSMARHQNVRVALIDLDLRRPHIATIFSHAGACATEDFLRGDATAENFLVCVGDNLAIGASQHKCAFPAEILHGPKAAQILAKLCKDLAADIVIYNLPALLENDDCLGLLPLMETTLLVVGAEFSSIEDIDIAERQLRARTQLHGVVLNKCRFETKPASNFQA